MIARHIISTVSSSLDNLTTPAHPLPTGKKRKHSETEEEMSVITTDSSLTIQGPSKRRQRDGESVDSEVSDTSGSKCV